MRNASLLLGFLFVSGCGTADKPPPYANVSGKVLFNGKAIEKGTITFSTDGRPPAVLDITDGAFSGQSLVGSNKVSISYRRKTNRTMNLPPDVQERLKHEGESRNGNPNAQSVPEGEEMIPPEWGSSTKQIRVIESGVANQLEFDIKGK